VRGERRQVNGVCTLTRPLPRQRMPLVSRPRNIAMMLRTAKQVMNAVTRLKLPPKAPTRSPATKGPSLVTMRALPVQKPTAVERIWVGNSSGR